VIKFNTPATATKANSQIDKEIIEFDHSIEVPGELTFEQIKEIISIEINVPKDEFIMRKYSYQGNEIRNLEDRIDLTASSFLNLYVEYGKPLRSYSVRVNVFTCENDFSKFLIFPYKLINHGFFLTDTRISINEFKTNIINELNNSLQKIYSYNYSANKVLVREYKLEKPTKVEDFYFYY